MITVSLKLPQPPSVDEYWKPWRSRMVLTDAARAYQHTASVLARTQLVAQPVFPVFAKPVDVMVVVCWHRSRKQGDPDNRLKPLLDALQGIVYSNDAQVGCILMWRNDTRVRTAELDVFVQQWTLAQMPQLLLNVGAFARAV